jgi:hypothetical protein
VATSALATHRAREDYPGVTPAAGAGDGSGPAPVTAAAVAVPAAAISRTRERSLQELLVPVKPLVDRVKLVLEGNAER